jgi:hypothetical protein
VRGYVGTVRLVRSVRDVSAACRKVCRPVGAGSSWDFSAADPVAENTAAQTTASAAWIRSRGCGRWKVISLPQLSVVLVVVAGAALVGPGCEVVAMPEVACAKRRVSSTPVAVFVSVTGWSRLTVTVCLPPLKPPSTSESSIVFGLTTSRRNQRSRALKYSPRRDRLFLPFA